MALLGLLTVVVGFLIPLATAGDAFGTYLGACCLLVGLLVLSLAGLGYYTFRRRAALGATGGGAESATVAPSPVEWVCGACGADLRPDAKFCGECGEPVEE